MQARSGGERRWRGERAVNDSTRAAVIRHSEGRVRVHIPGTTQRDSGWLAELQSHAGIAQARLSERTENLLIEFDPRVIDEAAVLETIASHYEVNGKQAPDGWLRAECTQTLATQPKACVTALLDFEHYPDWQQYVASVKVLERDKRGRGSLVRVHGAIGNRNVRYVARYSYPSAREVCFEQADGELDGVRGRWSFRGSGRGQTRANFALEVKPGWRIGLMLRGPLYEQVRESVLEHFLAELRERVERLDAAR